MREPIPRDLRSLGDLRQQVARPGYLEEFVRFFGPVQALGRTVTQDTEIDGWSFKKGERVKIAGLGILQVRKRAARMGRNPATGDPIKIKASKKVAFRPAKDLKEAV